MKIAVICAVYIFLFQYAAAAKLLNRCDYKYSSVIDGWLKYHEIPATWFDARLRCSFEGAVLASPITQVLSNELQMRMNENEKGIIVKEIFIGIHALFSSGDFHSINGIPLSAIVHKWAKNEPNNVDNKENCLSLNSKGMLSDVLCSKTLPYFCFKEGNETKEINDCGNTDPEYQFFYQTGSCYKFHVIPRTFAKANLACSAEGGYLAIINNESEAGVIKNLFHKYPASKMLGTFMKDVAYIGFSDWGEYGDWRTIHGQTLKEAGYSTFSPGEPNNYSSGEHCGSVYRNGQLNDIDCEVPYPFICEKYPTYPPVCFGVSRIKEKEQQAEG